MIGVCLLLSVQCLNPAEERWDFSGRLQPHILQTRTIKASEEEVEDRGRRGRGSTMLRLLVKCSQALTQLNTK